MEKILHLYKKEGETPLQALKRFQTENPEYKEVKLSYVGRLDPMAEGVLLVLVGEENKNREKYLSLDKEYEFEVLFGFETDTYDILGKVTGMKNYTDLDFELITLHVSGFKGKLDQPYPPYSSRTVLGKPLFKWAREGKLSEISIPTKEVEIYTIDVLENKRISQSALLQNIKERISKIEGDFRQEEIVELWQDALNKSKQDYFEIYHLKIACSSGTYVRSITQLLGKKIEVPALAYSIKRMKVGKYKRANSNHQETITKEFN